MRIRVLRPGDDGLVAAVSHPTEIFLYELALDEPTRRRRIVAGTGQVVEVWTF